MNDWMTPDALLFFEGRTGALPLYEALMRRIRTLPDVRVRVQKTQITLSNRRVFACVSFARVRKKAELPPDWLVLSLGLGEPLCSARVAQQTEPYPGRWTNHLVIGSEDEVDDELASWIRAAYDFAAQK